MSWLRLKLAAWLSVGNIRLIANQQKQINSLEDSVGRQIGQILEILKDRTATDPNPRKDIADFQQRLDALCRVCGVEVVITDGEVYTAEVSPRAVLRSEEAAHYDVEKRTKKSDRE